MTSQEARRPESEFNRTTMQEARRQPAYGKRRQLIEDGINDPELHLELALKLEHPFATEESLKAIHQEASMASDPGECNLRRFRTLAEWRVLSRSAEEADIQQNHEAMASQKAKRLGRKPLL